ncbi:hypothetical protein [Actinokineospora terrae]|uniref:hypothetical protein n=1 Tax=Actinokineospora terrae TaxID=155974 RepID=UPI001160696C|nr:hypothetical protein [Actinokineospora terrae]
MREAIGALEIVHGVVPPGVLPALEDLALRKAISTRLEDCGRTLINVEGGWTSGYRDDVADTLVESGLGVLPVGDRAVLVLLLLRTVAIPRARGNTTGETWGNTDGVRGTSIDDLAQNRNISKTQIKDSMSRLCSSGLVERRRSLLFPGPSLLRLTSKRSAQMWENLLLLAAPASLYAQAVRARRTGAVPPDNTLEVG